MLIGFLALVIAFILAIEILYVMQCPVILHLCNIYGFYSRGIIMMVLRGGLINVGHHCRPRCEMHGPPLQKGYHVQFPLYFIKSIT